MSKSRDDQIAELLDYSREISSLFANSDDEIVRRKPVQGGVSIITSEQLVKEEQVDDTSESESVLVPSQHFQRFQQSRPSVKYTEAEKIAFRESCVETYVHDYSERDFYHYSDQDRTANDKLISIGARLDRVRRTYRRVDQYIEAMRTVHRAWSILATSSPLHTREEFMEMVADGTVVSNRIPRPKLEGHRRYNQDLIADYISNEELDPTDLLPKERVEDTLYRIDDDTDTTERFISEEEIAEAADREGGGTTSVPVRVYRLKNKHVKTFNSSIRYHRKKKKDGSRGRDRISAEMYGKILGGVYRDHYHDSGSLGLYGISNIFQSPTSKEKSKPIFFDGSWRKSHQVKAYEIAMEQERLAEPYVYDPSVSVGDVEMQEFYRNLDRHGMSTVKMKRRLGNDDRSISKKAAKENKRKDVKMEKRILNRIYNMNESSIFTKHVRNAEKDYNRRTRERDE